MSSLWRTTSSAEWQAQLASVDSRIQSLAKSGLLELDRWWVQELPSVMQAREQLFLEKDEIVKLVEWKLTRGKWRPKLLDYAKHASEEEVVAATKKAFACLSRSTSIARSGRISQRAHRPQGNWPSNCVGFAGCCECFTAIHV